MNLIDLSHTIVPRMAQWPGDEQPLELPRHSEHGADSHMSSALEMGCHVGTHIDGALHFRAGAPGIDKLPLSAFSGPGLVLDLRPRVAEAGGNPVAFGPEILEGLDLDPIDFLLLLTGWDRHWGTERYYREWPWLLEALAHELVRAGLKGVGLDTPSLDPFGGQAVHEVCAAADMINIENLTNLDALPQTDFLFQVLPLKLQGTEASPVRAAAWVDAP